MLGIYKAEYKFPWNSSNLLTVISLLVWRSTRSKEHISMEYSSWCSRFYRLSPLNIFPSNQRNIINNSCFQMISKIKFNKTSNACVLQKRRENKGYINYQFFFLVWKNILRYLSYGNPTFKIFIVFPN